MPAGLQVWDQNGSLILDTTSVLASFCGRVTIGGSGAPASGSISNPLLALGTPWFQLQTSISDSREAWRPRVSISGQTVSWSFPHATLRPSAKIIYGIR